jgi:hypothetical protein
MGRLALPLIAAVPVLLLGACSTPSEPTGSGTPSTGAPVGPSPSTTVPDLATPSAPPSPDPPRSSVGAPAYSASVERIDAGLRRRMRFSHRPGCPVPLADLRYLRMSHVDLQGKVRTGEMVVHADHAEAVTKVFERLYDARWPVARMRLVDVYGGDDDRSMAANNTSAYNCRRVAGSSAWSNHAYGAAIDVNPVQNPYVTDAVAPPAGRRFAAIERSPGAQVPPGVVRSGDVVVRAFAAIGWEWGGDWTSSKDYQHFSASGR